MSEVKTEILKKIEWATEEMEKAVQMATRQPWSNCNALCETQWWKDRAANLSYLRECAGRM